MIAFEDHQLFQLTSFLELKNILKVAENWIMLEKKIAKDIVKIYLALNFQQKLLSFKQSSHRRF